MQQNAQKYVPRQAMKREVAEAIRATFYAINQAEAERQLEILIETYQEKAPKLAEWAAKAIPGPDRVQLPGGTSAAYTNQ